MAEFIRCECGVEWTYRLNIMDDKPMWFRPKVKRGNPCKHTTEQAQVLVGGGWEPLQVASQETT